MENKVRRRVGFGNPVEEIVEEEAPSSPAAVAEAPPAAGAEVPPATAAEVPPADPQPAPTTPAPEPAPAEPPPPDPRLESLVATAVFWRRQAILARIGVVLLLVAAAAGLWLVQDAEERLKALEAQLAQTQGYLAHAQQYEADAILLGYDFPITISSHAELVAYLTGKGKRLLDREVPAAQHAAFIAALAADPEKPGRYVAKVPFDGGFEKTYVVQVTDYVYFRTR